MSNLTLPRVIGHRGACAYAPENTLSSFKKAYELGCKWVEFDVKLTSDQELIIFHDDTLERMVGEKALVEQLMLKQIQQFDIGSWFSPLFKNEHIPTFLEVIDFLGKHDMTANVEIKPSPGFEVQTAEKTIEMIQQNWPTHILPPLISSFAFDSLKTARCCDPIAMLGLLMRDRDLDWLAMAQELNCVSIHVHEKILDKSLIDQIKSKGYNLLSFTVNDKDRACELFDLGVDCVFSDCPDKIMCGIK